jgi:hypothetical protein
MLLLLTFSPASLAWPAKQHCACRPACSPSLDHYFDIKKYSKHGLDWSATVDARRSFLSQCPASTDQGMPERIDAISRGAGKCDPEYLNRTYADTTYKWRKNEYRDDSRPPKQRQAIKQQATEQ